MLHLPDPFLVQVPLCFLVAVIVGSTRWGVVRGCLGIENPDVKKCTL